MFCVDKMVPRIECLPHLILWSTSLTSKSNQFVFVPKCTSSGNLVKFPQTVYEILCSQAFAMHRQTDIGQPENILPPATMADAKKQTTEHRSVSDADLSLHVHDDHRVGAVTHDELFDITWQRMNTVYSNVCACKTSQRLECVQTFGTLDIPHLDCSVRTCANTSQIQTATQ